MAKNHLNLRQMGLLMVVTPVLLSLLFCGCLAYFIFDAEKNYDDQLRSTILAMRIYDSEQILTDAFCQIVNSLDKEDPTFQTECDRLEIELKKMSKALNQWPGERNLEKDTIKDLQGFADESVSLIRKAKIVHGDKSIKAKNRHKHLDKQLQSILFNGQTLVRDLTQFEEGVTLNLTNILFQRTSLLWICLYGGLLTSACFCLWMAFLFSKVITERLKIVHDNAQLLAIGKPVLKTLEGVDELSELNKVLVESSQVLANSKSKELAVLSNSNEVLCSLDTSLRFLTVGQSAKKLWGIDADELIASPIAQIVVKADLKKTIEKFHRVVSEKKESRFEFRVKKSDGSYLYTQWTASLNADTNKIYCISRDVSERAELEKLKQQFLSAVSHDLRTPLASIMHSFNLLIERDNGILSTKILKMLKTAKVSVSRLLRLVNELLEIDKLESGKLTVEPQFVSSYDICVEAIEAVKWFASNRKIKIEHDLQDISLLGDEKRLIQVLINLLSNALKFSPENSTVWVTASKLESFGKISIIDQGPGISEADQETIFEKYTQTKSSDSSVIKGTGLGLSICSAIVEAHEGDLGVESRMGEGCTFWIRIPLFVDGNEDYES